MFLGCNEGNIIPFVTMLSFEFIHFYIAETNIRLDVDPSEYRDSLVDYLMLRVYAVVTVNETGQSWAGEDRFIMEKPELEITVISEKYHLKNSHFYSV